MLSKIRWSHGARCGVLALILSSCAPTVKSTLPTGRTLPASLAVLPADYAVEIPRQRVDLVRDAVVNELRNSRFVIVEDQVVSQICSTPQCPERARLTRDYLVDGFVTVSLSSFSKNNFVAGYYNQLEGSISVTDSTGKELVSVSHAENESGGLLLQSGQIFQAIISTVKHSGDGVFDNLAERFARSVVEKLPEPVIATANTQPEGLSLALNSVTTQWETPTSYTVCAQGTPHSFAYILLGTTRTPLRETKPGTYCTAFSSLVTNSNEATEAVELRTAFGNSIRQNVTIPSEPPCNLQGRVAQLANNKLDILCTNVGSDSSSSSKGCSESVPLCKVDKVLVYQAPDASGPYQKVSEVKASSLQLPQANTVAIVTIGRGGIPSQPVNISAKR
jgi:hypothetical protein